MANGTFHAGLLPFNFSSLYLLPVNLFPKRYFSRWFFLSVGVFHYYIFPVCFFTVFKNNQLMAISLRLELVWFRFFLFWFGIVCLELVGFGLVRLGQKRLGLAWFNLGTLD